MADKKAKHILVVSDPPAAPGYLPRLRYLCEYLMRQGYQVTMLTEEYEPLLFDHHYPIETIRMFTGSTFDWFIKTIWTLLTDWHNKAFAKKAIDLITYQQSHYDLVLCTAFSDFPLGAALRIAKQLKVPFLCDIRDLDEQVDNSTYQYHHQSALLMPFRKLYRSIHIRRRNKVLQAADAVTTVSPWHADFIRTFNKNVQVVYNGFDAKQFYPEDICTELFTITYIGSLFEWQKPALTVLQQAINELNNPHIVPDIHTPQSHPVAHNQLGETIRRSGIMIVLTNEHTHGMLTTKFYEALGCEKPILCIPSDYGSLAELIQYTNAGIATDNIEEIKAFIMEHYCTWEEKGYSHQTTRHREEFSKETQWETFSKLIDLL